MILRSRASKTDMPVLTELSSIDKYQETVIVRKDITSMNNYRPLLKAYSSHLLYINF